MELGQLDSNQRIQESKSCALPLGDGPSFFIKEKKLADTCIKYPLTKRWIQGFEPWASRATIWRANQLRYTHHKISVKQKNVPEGIRTPDPRLRRPLLYPAELRTHNLPFGKSKRVMGIEPTYLAWKASVLPLNYTRMQSG